MPYQHEGHTLTPMSLMPARVHTVSIQGQALMPLPLDLGYTITNARPARQSQISQSVICTSGKSCQIGLSAEGKSRLPVASVSVTKVQVNNPLLYISNAACQEQVHSAAWRMLAHEQASACWILLNCPLPAHPSGTVLRHAAHRT